MLENTVNHEHMELLIHIFLNRSMFNLSGRFDSFEHGISVTLNAALMAPYYMHQLLAYSARHLAFLHPERVDLYMHQAIMLQTRALSLFNNDAAMNRLDRSNCEATALFSSDLGLHLLADMLAKREPGGLDAFITHFVPSARMVRGVYDVVMSVWTELMESGLGPVLSFSSKFSSHEALGDHCRPLSDMMDSAAADGLVEEDKSACRLTIRYLQRGFDAVFEHDKVHGGRFRMIYIWVMLVPPKFTSLLEAKQPQAIVILGYYALLLFHGRSLWQVGNAGAYLMSTILDYLEPQWHYWLADAKNIIVRDYRREQYIGTSRTVRST